MTDQVPSLEGGVATQADREDAMYVLSEQATELADVRSAAGKWQTALGGLAGGISVFSIVKGRQDLTGLGPPWPIVAGSLLAVALALSVVGALLAMRAAFGLPGLRDVGKLRQLVHKHRQAVLAQRLLRGAVILTIVSLFAFAGCIGVIWYAPRDKGPQLRVVPVAGDHFCGSVIGVVSGQLIVRTSDGTRTISLGSVAALTPVDVCPAP